MNKEVLNKNKKLIQWVKENDGFIHEDIYINTQIYQNNVHRCIYYKNQQKIKKNDRLTSIPKKLVINDELFKNIPTINAFVKNLNDHAYNAKILDGKALKTIFVLICEKIKGASSFFHPYINILPKFNVFDDYPLNVYLKSVSTFDRVDSINPLFMEKLREMHKELLLIVDILEKYDNQYLISDKTKNFNDLIKWAYFIYKTRTWKNGLVPFNDMFNHNNHSNIALSLHSNQKKGESFYTFNADKQFESKKDEFEIFINYMHFNTIDLFLHYNFVHKADVNFLYIPFKFKTTTEFNKQKTNEIKKHNLSHNKILISNDGPSKDLFKILRILSLTQKEYSQQIGIQKDNKYNDVISYQNESKSIRLLFKIILDIKKTTYTFEKLNTIYCQLESFKDVKLSSSDSIIKNVCVITLQEYKILEDALIWIENRWAKILKNTANI